MNTCCLCIWELDTDPNSDYYQGIADDCIHIQLNLSYKIARKLIKKNKPNYFQDMYSRNYLQLDDDDRSEYPYCRFIFGNYEFCLQQSSIGDDIDIYWNMRLTDLINNCKILKAFQYQENLQDLIKNDIPVNTIKWYSFWHVEPKLKQKLLNGKASIVSVSKMMQIWDENNYPITGHKYFWLIRDKHDEKYRIMYSFGVSAENNNKIFLDYFIRHDYKSMDKDLFCDALKKVDPLYPLLMIEIED